MTVQWTEAVQASRIERLAVGIAVDAGRVLVVLRHRIGVTGSLAACWERAVEGVPGGVVAAAVIDALGDQVLATGRQAAGLEFAAEQEGTGLEAMANNALEFAGSGSWADLEATGIGDVARAHIAELVFALEELADTGRGVVVQVGPALADAQTEGLEAATGNCCKAEQPPSWLDNL